MRESADELYWVRVKIGGRNINNLRCGDDIPLIATSVDGLQRLVDKVESDAAEYQLEISTKKTKVMTATKNPTKIKITYMQRGAPKTGEVFQIPWLHH